MYPEINISNENDFFFVINWCKNESTIKNNSNFLIGQSKKWPPWMTHELIHIVTKKRQLWKKYKSDPSDENHGRFKDADK